MSALPMTVSVDWVPTSKRGPVREVDVYIDGKFVSRLGVGEVSRDIFPGIGILLGKLRKLRTTPASIRRRGERLAVKSARRKRGARR